MFASLPLPLPLPLSLPLLLIPFSSDVVASLMDPISFASKALENLAMGEFVSTRHTGKLPGRRLVCP